ncbi:hypothetical protein EJB05_28374, partial [Eragrostis curvula]
MTRHGLNLHGKRLGIVGLGGERHCGGDTEQVRAVVAGTMDGVTDTMSAWHPIAPLLALLKPMGPLELPIALPSGPVGRASPGAWSAASRSARAMLDFAGRHSIGAEVEPWR